MLTLFDLMFNKVKTIQTGAELFFCVALNHYTKEFLNTRLSLEGVRIAKGISSQPWFNFVVTQQDGVIFDSSVKPVATMKPYKYMDFYNKINIDNLFFDTGADGSWVFGVDRADINRTIRMSGETKLNYLYILAKWYVLNYIGQQNAMKTGSAYTWKNIVFDNGAFSIGRDEYSCILILKKFGNQWFADNRVKVNINNEGAEDLEWCAYCEEKRMRGMMPGYANAYDAKEKREYLTKELKFAQGDVVILFQRKQTKNNGDVTKNLIAAYPAVICKIGKSDITLSYCTQIETLLTRQHHVQSLKDKGCRGVRSSMDPRKFNMVPKTFDYLTIGIEGYSSFENWVIIPPIRDDSTVQWFRDVNGKEFQHELDTIETIYAVFEDRKVPYDKGRFLKRYFNNTKPFYDKVKDGDIKCN